MPKLNKTVAVMGGTFDPIHYGHLRTALDVKQQLGFDQVLLMPCAQPNHRVEPERSAKQRLIMDSWQQLPVLGLTLTIESYCEMDQVTWCTALNH
jgi:cytidyltransferase-like protein